MTLHGDNKRKYQREWVAKRRSKWFENKSCAWCESIEELQLHHIDPKEKEHHVIWSWSWKRILNEVSKCIVLCKNCHEEFHSKEKTLDDYHGTATGYIKYKCKCEHCRNWKRDVDDRYRSKLS